MVLGLASVPAGGSSSDLNPIKTQNARRKSPYGSPAVPPQTKRVECALAQGEGMTVNRRWLAREWLILLGGLLVGIFVEAVGIRLRPLLLIPLWFPYILFQIIRVTVWVIRTLRETVE